MIQAKPIAASEQALRPSLLKSFVLENLVSPLGLILLSYGVFLVAWLFPPNLYTYYVGEPDRMYLDLHTFLFMTGMEIVFILGLFLGGRLQRAPLGTTERYTLPHPSVLLILLPVAVGGALVLLHLLLTVDHVPSLLEFLLSRQGDQIKDSLRFNSPALFFLSIVTVMQMGILWWAHWRYLNMRSLRRSEKLLFHFGYWPFYALSVVSSILRVERKTLMPLLAGTICLAIMGDILKISKIRQVFIRAVSSVLLCVLLFMLVGFFRGRGEVGRGSREAVGAFMGYSIAGYNRLAAVLAGDLRFPYAGRGEFESSFFSDYLRPYKQYFGSPTFNMENRSEYPCILAAGLNSSFNLVSAPGYIYMDIGNWVYLFYFLVAFFCASTWRAIHRGTVFGAVMYPFVAFALVDWFGVNMLFTDSFFFLCFAAAVLAVYERMFPLSFSRAVEAPAA
jgi:hypothetical protein